MASWGVSKRSRGGGFWGGLLSGVGVGAAAMYLFDPRTGNRRRAVVRDKALRVAHEATNELGKRERDLANRSRGVLARARGRLERAEVPDATLAERVRAKLGHVCSHPAAIAVSVRAGSVELKGPILAAERARLLSEVKAIPGVKDIDDDLDAFESAAGIPALQGSGTTSQS